MGTGGAGGASAPPTKLLGEQVIHPAPPVFSVFFRISWATSYIIYIGNRGDRGEHGGKKCVTLQVVSHLSVVITYLCSCLTVTSLTELNILSADNWCSGVDSNDVRRKITF